MGSTCTTTTKQLYTNNSDKEPEDTEEYNRPSLPSLQFQMEVSNIKLRNLNEQEYTGGRQLSMQLFIDGVLDAILQPKSVGPTIKWKVTHRVRLSANEYELRKKFLKIYVFSQNRVKLATVNLNIYKIAVGPYHQDFPIKFSDKKSGRISLDVKISQLVEIIIQPMRVGIDLVTEHPGEVFYYTLRILNDDGREIESEESYKAQTILYNKKISNSQVEIPSPALKRRQSLKSKKSLVLQNGKKLSWSNEQAKILYQLELPRLTTSINVSHIAGYSFEFQLWRVQTETSNDNQSDSVCEEIHLYADAHINFNKVFASDPQVVRRSNIDFEQRQATIIEKIWNEGKLLGNANLMCSVLVPPFLKQMIVCLRTQKGVLGANHFFSSELQNQQSACTEIKKLNELKQSVEDAVVRLNLHKNDRRNNQFRMLNAKHGIFEGIQQMYTVLQGSANKHIRMYRYSSYDDLRKGQFALLDIGFKLLECLADEQASIADVCWKALIQLINRDEFNLLYVGFTEEDQKNSETKEAIRQFKEGIEMRLKYQTFIYQALRASLTSLNKKALLDNERVFTILFSAQAFFRIPEYRFTFLQLLYQGEKDRQLLEEIGLTNSLLHIGGDPALKSFLDWEANFYLYLRRQPGYEQNIVYLKQTLDNSHFRKKMQQRSIGFFYIIVGLVEYLSRLAPFLNISWYSVPGYSELVRIFLCEMQSRDIRHYPDSLKEASSKLLCNEDLLNVQMRILFGKTNIHAPMTVLKTLEILDSYFTFFATHLQRKLPTSFDYKYLYAGIRIMLNSDHSFVVARCLSLIYKHYPLFSSNFRKDLSLCLMGQLFFRLFLNWASNVRMVFHHIMLYRIFLDFNSVSHNKHKRQVNTKSISSTGMLDDIQMGQLKHRYETVMNILAQTSLYQSKNPKQISWDKHYYKRMKSKLIGFRLKCSRGSLKVASSKLTQTDSSMPTSPKIFYPTRSKSESTPLKQICMNLSADSNSPFNTQDVSVNKRAPSGMLLTEIVEVEDIRQRKKRRQTSLDHDWQIGEMGLNMAQYVQVALKQYSQSEDLFKRSITPTYSHNDVPTINVKVPMDQGDIRPDDIDEW